MLYFSQAPYSPRTAQETDQWGKVLRFKAEFLNSGVIWEYKNENDFVALVQDHLFRYSFEIERQENAFTVVREGSPIICRMEASPILARAEGITELIGDIVLNFSGNLPLSIRGVTQSVNISLLLNTTITNRLMPDLLTDALLVGDESGRAVAIRASLIAPNVLLFRSVAIDTPTGVRRKIFRITNVRANAGALGTAPGLNVTAMVRVDDVPVSDPVQVVAWINKGLSYQVRNPDSSEMLDDKQPCLSQSTECSGRRIATLRFVENFANAFKPRTAAIRGDRFASFSNTEDYWVGISESGQCNKVWSDDHGRLFISGLADFGTRFVVVFNNLPAGVSLLVSTHNIVCSSPASIDAFLTETEVGPFSAVQATDIIDGKQVAELTVTNGTAIATWEVVKRDHNSAGWLEFGVYIRFVSDAARNSPALGTASVTSDLAPTTTVMYATTTHAIPRFQRFSGVVDVFTIGR